MNRFFVSAVNVNEKTITIDNKSDIKHISKVLRLKVGDEIEVSDAVKWEYVGRILSIGSDELKIRIEDKQAFAREPATDITLFQGIPKQAKMDGIIQKSVELGVKAIVPVFMKRTVIVDKGRIKKRLARWQRISDESVKQCKRGIIHEISQPMDSKDAIAALKEYDIVIFTYENENETTIKDMLRSKKISPSDRIALITGPEGGFSDDEAHDIKAVGGQSVSLGKTILRTETAGPAAIAMIMYELEL